MSIVAPDARRGRGRRLAGLAVRTRNADETNPDTARIPGLWGRIMGEDWFGRLEKLGASGPLVAVYSDYESDASGPYRLLVGREVPPGAALAADVEVAQAAAGAYLVFRCRGPVPGVVVEGWRRVWDFFAGPDAPRRAYTADMEVYDADGGGLEIWVAVRSAGSQ